MRLATIILQNLIRLSGVTLLALGFLFWSGREFSLLPLHMRLGEALVLILWILSGIGLAAGLPLTLTISGVAWGALVIGFGMNMGGLLPGRAHEVIRVLHLLFGLGAIGLSESLASRIKRKQIA